MVARFRNLPKGRLSPSLLSPYSLWEFLFVPEEVYKENSESGEVKKRELVEHLENPIPGLIAFWLSGGGYRAEFINHFLLKSE